MLIVLREEELIGKVAPLLLELGLFDATILDGEGAENAAAAEVPVFSSFRSIFGEGYRYNKTLLVPVSSEDDVQEFTTLCDTQGIHFKDGSAGYILVFPVSLAVGLGEG